MFISDPSPEGWQKPLWVAVLISEQSRSQQSIPDKSQLGCSPVCCAARMPLVTAEAGCVASAPNRCGQCFALLGPDALLSAALFCCLYGAVRALQMSRLSCTAALKPTWLPLTLLHWLPPWFWFFIFNLLSFNASEVLFKSAACSPLRSLPYFSPPQLWPLSLMLHPGDCWLSQLHWGS